MEHDKHAGEDQWPEALKHLQTAIELLDRSQAPPHIAAHVDLAAHQLKELIDGHSENAGLGQIDRKAEPH